MAFEPDRRLLRRSLIWSALPGWGNRLVGLAVTAGLARELDPADFGLVATLQLALIAGTSLTGLGLGEALVQRRGLVPAQVTPVLFVILPLACLIPIMALLVPGLSPGGHLATALASLPLMALALLQEAMMRRALCFRGPAVAALIGGLAGGAAALIAARTGLGAWSAVVQLWITALAQLIYLWSAPVWRPVWPADPSALRGLLRFGLPVLGQRLIDLAGTRCLDLVLIARLGLAGYASYAIGQRLAQVLFQLLQTGLQDVMLALLSRGGDRRDLARLHALACGAAARLMAPVLVIAAATAPELCLLIFGDRWPGVAAIAAPLLLLGALQSVQHLNGAFLLAHGRPGLVLAITLGKTLLQISALMLWQGSDVLQLVQIHVLATLMMTPVSFALALHSLAFADPTGIRAQTRNLARQLAPPLATATATYCAVLLLRPLLEGIPIGAGAKLGILALSGVASQLVLSLLIDRDGLSRCWRLVMARR